jgi:hypothetical protein
MTQGRGSAATTPLALPADFAILKHAVIAGAETARYALRFVIIVPCTCLWDGGSPKPPAPVSGTGAPQTPCTCLWDGGSQDRI